MCHSDPWEDIRGLSQIYGPLGRRIGTVPNGEGNDEKDTNGLFSYYDT